jgi:hypothetical protein
MLQAGRSPVLVPDKVDFFNLPNPSSRTMALGSIQPLTEMSIRNIPGGKSGRYVGLTILSPSVSRMSENVGTSTSRNAKSLHGLYRENLAFYYDISWNIYTYNIQIKKLRLLKAFQSTSESISELNILLAHKLKWDWWAVVTEHLAKWKHYNSTIYHPAAFIAHSILQRRTDLDSTLMPRRIHKVWVQQPRQWSLPKSQCHYSSQHYIQYLRQCEY